MDERKRNFLNNRRVKGRKPEIRRKSEFDKRNTHEEVQQIKKNLINFARTSWGKQWINSILKTGRPFRMQRGIQYAEDDDRINDLSINPGQIFATVQGTAPSPYRVKINFETIPEEGWTKIIGELSEKVLNLIKLIDGILPKDILEIFEKLGYPLFLDASNGLNATCSCPDQAIPCKHIAATILYVAKVLDYDPFILLIIRGKLKKEILKALSLDQRKHSSVDANNSGIVPKQEKKVDFSFSFPKISIQELSHEQATSESDINMGFKFDKPPKVIETLENLEIPPNLEDPQTFKKVFNEIYHFIANQVYKKAHLNQ